MHPSPEQSLRDYKKASKDLRKKIGRDPEHAKTFLVEAGILVRKKSAPNGVELAKRFRPSR